MRLVTLIVATLFAVSSISGAQGANKKFKVVTTFTVFADMAKNIVGDVAVVESITKPGAEIHNYQPTPRIFST